LSDLFGICKKVEFKTMEEEWLCVKWELKKLNY